MRVGAIYKGRGSCEFVVWAPFRGRVEVKILGPRGQMRPMQKDAEGYWRLTIKETDPGSRYLYILDGSLERPDPASYYQPIDVHQPSQVVDHDRFVWRDHGWVNIPLSEMLMYEIHVGTFTPEGTFRAVIPRLKDLAHLGVNTINIMPVAQFPGGRNWGYDGVYPFAVQNTYGGPQGLKELVDACHAEGMAVVLDVVYNHLGPEGNYLGEFGPYFTEKYRTPWGKAVNFDDAYNGGVRNFFIWNALYWFEHFHVDGLRLDAVHAIKDDSSKPFLKELKERVGERMDMDSKRVYLIAESDLNDVRIIQPSDRGGFALDAQWSDDYHHAVHALLTGERNGYYGDFGSVRHLKKALEESFVYSWDYSTYRKRYHGSCAREIPAEKFVVCVQNHDQVGNRISGERLSALVSFEGLKAAAGLLFFSPYVPLIFMGEEYAEEAPFHYFVSHSDKELIEAVRKGREDEFASFEWKEKPPDPQDTNTFSNSKISWTDRESGRHQIMLGYYRELIRIRKEHAALKNLQRNNIEVSCLEDRDILHFRRWDGNDQVFVMASFCQERRSVDVDLPEGTWVKVIDSMDGKWDGPGALLEDALSSRAHVTLGPLNFAAYKKET